MKSPLLLLVLTLCTSAALAEPPALPANEAQKAASELVDKQLLTPLKKAESRRKRFSRAAPVPVQRRVRVLDGEAQADIRGKKFVRFAIDVRRAWNEQGPWEKDSVVGCAYPNEREVFVQHGSVYRSARSMLGDDEKERPDVCRVAPPGAVVEARSLRSSNRVANRGRPRDSSTTTGWQLWTQQREHFDGGDPDILFATSK